MLCNNYCMCVCKTNMQHALCVYILWLGVARLCLSMATSLLLAYIQHKYSKKGISTFKDQRSNFYRSGDDLFSLY